MTDPQPEADNVDDQSGFSSIHFNPEKIDNQKSKYVIFGWNEEFKNITARLVSHQELLSFSRSEHPAVRSPIENDPDHEILSTWNEATNGWDRRIVKKGASA